MITITQSLFFILFSSLGGLTSRWCGKAPAPIGHGLEQFIYAIPYLAVGIWVPLSHDRLPVWQICVVALLSLFSYAIAFLGKRMGHGQWFYLKWGNRVPENDEKLDVIVKLFFGEDKGGMYWRSVFGMTLSGTICGVGAFVVLCAFHHYVAAVIVLAGASAKGIAYMIGWGIYWGAVKLGMDDYILTHNRLPATRLEKVVQPTVIGEILTGVFGWGSASYLI